jgi:ferredoxin-thioredoxin reductase catalytic subunit
MMEEEWDEDKEIECPCCGRLTPIVFTRCVYCGRTIKEVHVKAGERRKRRRREEEVAEEFFFLYWPMYKRMR